jgi:citrate lyase beta subunit
MTVGRGSGLDPVSWTLFPLDSQLSLRRLGTQDEVVLEFALRHADGVGVSFVSTPQDVARIGERLRRAGRPDFGIILKLETRGAIRNLAAILFEALKYDAVGLMIGRGDLAVELSFERLAEMQEEILWFGEACHLPVIWATQADVRMAQQLLHRPDIIAAFQQMGREGMTKRVTARLLPDAGPVHRIGHRPLNQ